MTDYLITGPGLQLIMAPVSHIWEPHGFIVFLHAAINKNNPWEQLR